MPKSLPEVFVSDVKSASYVSKQVKKGHLRKLGSRVYTTNLKDPPEILVKRHAWFIVESLFPGAVIADRTALEHRLASDGSIFIISKKKRGISLPGLSIHPRKGHGPLSEDRPFMNRLFLSCPGRAYLENLTKTRTRKGIVSRRFSRQEIEEKLEDLLQSAGIEALQRLRDEAKKIAPLLKLSKEFKELDRLIGAPVGTRQASISSPVALARLQGYPYDPKRLDLFQKLFEFLANSHLERRKIVRDGVALPFFEAYFSNFIEGTEFEVEEAAQIIFEGKIPTDRPEDAHDILGTYQIASDHQEMQKTPKDEDEFLFILKKWHAVIMQSRPEVRLGQFKTVANRSGMTFFVVPELVEGTLAD